MPVDRISYSFNYFHNLSQSVNERFESPVSRIQGYRHTFGFEKTILDQRASIGLRLPLNTVRANESTVPGFGNTSTALGDLSVYFKYALWMDREQGRVLSMGMAVTAPTGPSTFGGARWLRGVHNTGLQPFLGFQWTQDRWYLIGFSAIDVSTGPRDVTIFYNDLAIGYFAYRSANPDALIKAIAPTFEVHVNTPLTHRDVFNPRDVAGSANVVDLTSGLNFFLTNRAILSLGVVDPVSSPRPFGIEALALLNVLF